MSQPYDTIGRPGGTALGDQTDRPPMPRDEAVAELAGAAGAGGGAMTDDALLQALFSDNESDQNGEAANVVDGLFAIARALDRVARALERRGAAEDEP
jgi:hypothetical protein